MMLIGFAGLGLAVYRPTRRRAAGLTGKRLASLRIMTKPDCFAVTSAACKRATSQRRPERPSKLAD
jgi:hypothetical protein